MQKLFHSLNKRIFKRRHFQMASQSLREISTHCIDPFSAIGAAYAWKGDGYCNSLDLKQSAPEIFELVRILESNKVSRVLEIGSHKGGTLFIWAQLIKTRSESLLVSVDLPGGDFGGGLKRGHESLFYSFCTEGQKLEIIRGDSHSTAVAEKVNGTVGHTGFDFIFIDGDHSYEGVKQDYEMYSKFIRPGGIIAFHDIVERPDQPNIQVAQFWRELTQSGELRTTELIGNAPHRQIGIGVVLT